MRLVVSGKVKDAIVGGRDRAANSRFGGWSGVRDSLADGFNSGLRRQFTGGVAAHAIDHEKDAARGIDKVAILIMFAQQTGIGSGGGAKWAIGGHAKPRKLLRTPETRLR